MSVCLPSGQAAASSCLTHAWSLQQQSLQQEKYTRCRPPPRSSTFVKQPFLCTVYFSECLCRLPAPLVAQITYTEVDTLHAFCPCTCLTFALHLFCLQQNIRRAAPCWSARPAVTWNPMDYKGNVLNIFIKRNIYIYVNTNNTNNAKCFFSFPSFFKATL